MEDITKVAEIHNTRVNYLIQKDNLVAEIEYRKGLLKLVNEKLAEVRLQISGVEMAIADQRAATAAKPNPE